MFSKVYWIGRKKVTCWNKYYKIKGWDTTSDEMLLHDANNLENEMLPRNFYAMHLEPKELQDKVSLFYSYVFLVMKPLDGNMFIILN